MKSELRGGGTLAVEVTSISRLGIHLRVGERELFMPFEEFPWFRDAPVSAVLKVELPASHHLYWPALDIDLHLDSIEHPERFPLKSAHLSNTALQSTGAIGD